MALPAAGLNKAQVSNYQNNGSLNALSHVLTDNIDKIGNDAAPCVIALRHAFAEEYQIYPSWDDLKNALKGLKDPVQREEILGPVLRRLAGAGLADEISLNNVLDLANAFNIDVEAYSTKQALKEELIEEERQAFIALQGPKPPLNEPGLLDNYNRRIEAAAGEIENRANIKLTAILENNADHRHPDQNMLAGQNHRAGGAPHAILKIWDNGQNKWFFEKPDAITHNQKYAAAQGHNYHADGAGIRAEVGKLLAVPVGTKVDLGKAFEKYNHKIAKKGFAAASDKLLSGMQQGLDSILNIFGVDSNPFTKLIGTLFSGLLKGVTELFPVLENVKNTFEKMDKTEESLIDHKEIGEIKKENPENPELAARTGQFADQVAALAETDRQGARLAGELTAAWRKDPDSEAVWDQLITSMSKNGLLHEANELIQKETHELVDRLMQIEAEIQPPPGNQRYQDLETLKNGAIRLLEDERLKHVKGYAEQNSKDQHALLKELRKLKPIVKEKNELEVLTEKSLELQAQAASLTAQEMAARGAGQADIEATLAERLLKVQAEIATLNVGANQAAYAAHKRDLEPLGAHAVAINTPQFRAVFARANQEKHNLTLEKQRLEAAEAARQAVAAGRRPEAAPAALPLPAVPPLPF